MKTQETAMLRNLILILLGTVLLGGCGGGGGSTPTLIPPGGGSDSPGFTAGADEMFDSRAKLEATPLPDGRILITGGYRTSPFVSNDTAEIFDPVTETYTDAGLMTTRRQCHTATRLPDGKVLIVGGNNELDHSYETAETFDPATGKFTATGSMTEERTCAMATLLPNGKVLVAGGYDSDGTYSDTAEVYDPATGTFGAPIQMGYTHGCHCQALLSNGLVLLTTGCTGAEHAELFDYRTETFMVIDDMALQRKYPFFQLLPDGRVLIAGGQSNGKSVSSAEIYTPAANGGPGSFTLITARLETSRWRGAQGLLPDGTVLLMGGTTTLADDSTQYLDSAEIFDPVTNTFSGAFEMSEARAKWPRFVMTGQGYGVVFGGIGADGEAVNTADIWTDE